MLLHRFYEPKLAQASYLVGCQATGEAVVIDPNRDVEQYLDYARGEGLRITHVTETHIHADFVSGLRELAQRTGARAYLSGEGGEEWRYAFADALGAELLHDGDEIHVGNVRLRALHTPGHTPEHLSFELTDGAATDRPMGVFTGDFLFVGDVGRPDLLERAAGYADTMEAGARTLYRSLARFKTRPDYLQIWPGHGAGSACGKALGAVPSSTLGYERIANWGLADMSEEEFVRQVLAGQPEPPRYFAEMKRVNKLGPSPRWDAPAATRLDAPGLAVVLGGMPDALVIDLRPAATVAQGYVPGTVNVPLGRSFPTWAGSTIPFDRRLYLIAADEEGASAREAAHDLSMIGYDRVEGWAPPAAIAEWAARADRPLESIAQVDVAELATQLSTGRAAVVDVRGRAEYEQGHLAGVPNVPLGELRQRVGELPAGPITVHCQSGARAAIAATLLRSMGREVANVTGGFAEWKRRGLPVETGGGAVASA